MFKNLIIEISNEICLLNSTFILFFKAIQFDALCINIRNFFSSEIFTKKTSKKDKKNVYLPITVNTAYILHILYAYIIDTTYTVSSQSEVMFC